MMKVRRRFGESCAESFRWLGEGPRCRCLHRRSTVSATSISSGGSLRNVEGGLQLLPKSFKILTYFVANAGRLLSKVWACRDAGVSMGVTGANLRRRSAPSGDAGGVTASRMRLRAAYPIENGARWAVEPVAAPGHVLVRSDQHETRAVEIAQAIVLGRKDRKR